jgi:hypothetical protein
MMRPVKAVVMTYDLQGGGGGGAADRNEESPCDMGNAGEADRERAEAMSCLRLTSVVASDGTLQPSLDSSTFVIQYAVLSAEI